MTTPPVSSGKWDDPSSFPARTWHGFVLALSLVFALTFRHLWPTEWFYDDGAIVLRYMDVFAQGGFYQYNLADPPVYGISGFVHGCLAGLLAASRVLSPQDCVLFVNTLGVVLTSAALLLILRVYCSSVVPLVLVWIVCLVASHFFVMTAFQALETPLHLGLVLLAYWTFLARHGRAMWFCFALAIISKLDAAPVVAGLGAVRLLELRVARSGRRIWLNELRIALLWAGIPLVIWLGLTTLLFGSPLPQTAYAKYFVHGHPTDRLAFVRHWWRADETLIWGHAAVALLLSVVAFFGRPMRARAGIPMLGLPLGLILLLVLYCLYNPNERMPWYYVLPQFMLVLAAATALLDVFDRLIRRRRRVGLALAVVVFSALFPCYLGRTLDRSKNAIDFIRRSEPERVAVGEYVRDHAVEGERLYTGFGYVARAAGIYTIDYSGLNSPAVTRLRQEDQHPLKALRPEWTAQTSLWNRAFQMTEGLQLQASFHGRSCDKRAAWRIFKRLDGDAETMTVTELLAPEEIRTDGAVHTRSPGVMQIDGRKEITFSCSRFEQVTEFRAGIARCAKPVELEVTLAEEGQAGSVIARSTVAARDDDDWATGRAQELIIPLPMCETPFDLRISQVAQGASRQKLRFFEPVWLYVANR